MIIHSVSITFKLALLVPKSLMFNIHIDIMLQKRNDLNASLMHLYVLLTMCDRYF